jgi:UDP-glucuronate 4-epimerase
MAAYKFMSHFQNNEPVTLYNNGAVERDFTHVSDVVESIARLIPILFNQEVGQHEVFNIGRGKPLSVKTYASTIAQAMKLSLAFQSAPLPENELQKTHSICDKLERCIQFKPQTNLETGAKEMALWFLENQA